MDKGKVGRAVSTAMWGAAGRWLILVAVGWGLGTLLRPTSACADCATDERIELVVEATDVPTNDEAVWRNARNPEMTRRSFVAFGGRWFLKLEDGK